MAKVRLTKQQVMNQYDVVLDAGGSADLSQLMNYRTADAYTAGSYGWNADIYDVSAYMPKEYRGKVALVTGDRSFGTHKIPYEMIRKACDKVKDTRSFDKTATRVRNNALRSMLKEAYTKVVGRDMGR